ncbi:MAG: sugar phosphate isomerase/epimerase [Phycisphaeraceae bacterium]|nr:sugar phosphate isomerase/epimerase [Phycisphaerales bacterium]MCB9859348.1 sugar phosphate isomerase/epimerase [Phycisphaeraceae bacterium]
MTYELDRRSFLTQSIAATALGAGVASASSAGSVALPERAGYPTPVHSKRVEGTSRTVLKSLKVGMIGVGTTIEEKFAAARDAGFDGVELDSPGNIKVDEVRSAMEKTGIRVPGVVNSTHWSKPFSHPDESVRSEMRESLKQSIRDCAAVGGTTVLLVPGVVNKDVLYEDAWTRSQSEIKGLLRYAQEHNITIALENVWNNFLLSPIEARAYMEFMESNNIGWYMDVGNIVRYGWPEHWIRALGRRIVKVDVKAYSRTRADKEGKWAGFNVEIGQAKDESHDFADECGWPNVMRALDEIGYGVSPDRPGWYSAEVGGGDMERLRFISQRMTEVLHT